MQEFIPKAIALMSGGLDSTLAARLIKDQGVEVIGLHLASPFGCVTDVQKSADALGIPLIVREKGEAYLDLVKHPRFGYGKNMNPCIDCRVFMFEFAELVREEQGAHFIVTGEVLGQRPMSQQRHAMNRIDAESDSRGKVLRPLSAKRFPPTEAELKGWVDREKLLEITGRGRGIQLELAKKYGIGDFAPPGGGCLLTEVNFSARLKDFFEVADTSGNARLVRSGLLRHGRYVRLTDRVRVIVGRNAEENATLAAAWESADAEYFQPENFLGPDAVAFGDLTDADRQAIGEIIVRYGKPGEERKIRATRAGTSRVFDVSGPMAEERLRVMMV